MANEQDIREGWDKLVQMLEDLPDEIRDSLVLPLMGKKSRIAFMDALAHTGMNEIPELPPQVTVEEMEKESSGLSDEHWEDKESTKQ